MPYRSDSPRIDASAINWHETGDQSDPTARLTAHISIAGCDMHLEALAVDHTKHRPTAVTASMRREMLASMMKSLECEFSTTTINDRAYFLIATPFSSA